MSNEPLRNIKHQLGEHFENYAVVAIDSDGNLIWEYNNWMIGVMLMERATECIEEDENPVVVEINEEDNDDDGWNEVPAMP
jgi:hypothetical protein